MQTTCCIDVGLRNLSLCIMNSGFDILLWNVYDVFDTVEQYCKENVKSSGKQCNKKCSLKYEKDNQDIYTCKIHFPKTIKQTVKNKIVVKNIDKYLLQEIAVKFQNKIDEIYLANKDIFDNLSSIYIELQPKCNPKMLFISHILYGKFIQLFKEKNIIIRFVRATLKLKTYDGPELQCNLKGKYAQRKWYSIQYAKWFLEKYNKTTSLNFLQESKKKDDLSDSLNFAINIILGIDSKKFKHKNGNCLK